MNTCALCVLASLGSYLDCLANRFATLIGVDLNPGSSAQLYSLALATFSADVSSGEPISS